MILTNAPHKFYTQDELKAWVKGIFWKHYIFFFFFLINFYLIFFFPQRQNLSNLGAKKFGIIGLSTIGCCLLLRTFNDTVGGGCMEGLNDYAQVFNKELGGLLKNLSSRVPRDELLTGKHIWFDKIFIERLSACIS